MNNYISMRDKSNNVLPEDETEDETYRFTKELRKPKIMKKRIKRTSAWKKINRN